MPNTYTQIHLQFVFAVKYREACINAEWEDELYKYITGIVQNHDHKLLAINGMPDHIHLLIGMRPTQSVSNLLQDIKGDSSKWIKSNKLTKHKFEWQEGYGAFSYGASQVDNVIDYIKQQKEHHRKRTFIQEYVEFLKLFKIEYDEQYIFKPLI
ncbi:MAG TPA: IS200/IS605 family transposase [Chitinophagales bacterium]|nr:IS200/IS605 family transposase [Chitinophagales bacterium]